jgi:hypothetical protein
MSLLYNISNYLLSKKESPKGNKQFLNWNQLSNVLVIAHENQLTNVVDFVNTCKRDNISVYVAIIYDGKPEQTPKPNFEHTILDKKQFNVFGLPNIQLIKKISVKPIDVLINLGNRQQIKSLAISKFVAAKCKISQFQNTIFDISINGDHTTSVSNFLEQVIVYLKMIRTTK